MNDFVPTYKSTLTDGQMVSITLALKASLDYYKALGFTIEDAPDTSHIGTCRDLLQNVEAIRMGNRRGGQNPFDIVMVEAAPAPVVEARRK